MNHTRARTFARGIGSLAILTALLVGPPAALCSLVGWPLPTVLPDLATLEAATRSGISDHVIIKALAVIGWLAWLQIALSIFTEVKAVVQGRPSVQLPVLPGFQVLVARLVAPIAMMTATLNPGVASASINPPVSAIEVVASTRAPVAPVSVPAYNTPAPATPATSATPRTDHRPTVIVERHDSYWAIAERTLDDGHRWREIRDLNVGRTMPSGETITAASELIRPGWVLELPADAVITEADSSIATGGNATASRPAHIGEGVASVQHDEITVSAGDSFWTLAEQQLADATGRTPTDADIAPYWAEMIEMNQDRLHDSLNPNLIYSGQELCVPPVQGEAAVAQPTELHNVSLQDGAQQRVDHPSVPAAEQSLPPDAAAPSPELPAEPVPQAPADEHGAGAAPTTAASLHQRDEGGEGATNPAPLVATGFASTALGVGVVRVVRHRRRQAAHRAPTATPHRPSDSERHVHATVLASADEVAIDDLRGCLGALATALATNNVAARPRIVQHSTKHLEVLLDAPSLDAPEGWSPNESGDVWTMTERPSPSVATICAAPLLVTLGQPDDSGQIYLDIEAEGIVALTGDQDTARAIARAVLAELALTPLAETLQVICVGDLATPDVTHLDHVTHADSWADVTDDLRAWSEQSHNAITSNGWSSTFIGRGNDPYHDALATIAVVASESPPIDLLASLRSNRPAALAVVVVGDVDSATTIVCTPDELTIPILGLACTPHPLEQEALDAVVDLIDSAGDADGETGDTGEPLMVLGSAQEPATPVMEVDRSIWPEPESDILVRLLGDIQIDGLDEPLRPKLTSALAYIAYHGDVSSERLEEAAWGGSTGSTTKRQVTNAISQCRAAIGQRRLPAAADGRYRAGPGLVADTELFESRVHRAATQEPADAAATLRSALDLVTGPVFTYRRADSNSFRWVDLENCTSTWELKITSTAQRCAELLVEVGNLPEAVDVCNRALVVMPAHTALTETLMRALAATGDRLAVKRAYDAHLAALAALDLDDAEESTVSLYDALLGAEAG